MAALRYFLRAAVGQALLPVRFGCACIETLIRRKLRPSLAKYGGQARVPVLLPPTARNPHSELGWFRNIADGAELRFIAADIFRERLQDALGVRWTDNHAGKKLALRHVGEQIDELQRELFRIVMEHHQVAELPDHFLLIGLDLYLYLLAPACAITASVFLRDTTIFFHVTADGSRSEFPLRGCEL